MRNYDPDALERPLRLFEAYGIEMEYMIVDASTLCVLPVTDEVLKAVAGRYVSDVEEGEIAWSNELVLHVVELKTNGPADNLEDLPALFQRDVGRVRRLLEPLGGRLMPGGMHPWMDPLRETRLWPHAYSPVYEAFDRIFSCRGHGWSNLQSVHVNLPFADDEEFGRLHAAIRLLLPLMPALAASSPVVEGRVNGTLDNRLAFYRTNARRIPSVTGEVIPEPAFTRRAYERDILERIYRDVAPHDPEGTLRYEWVNARGTIARFDRMALEIRVLDMQECPLADLATTALLVAAVRALAGERWSDRESQMRWPVDRLVPVLRATIRDAERAVIEDPAYLEAFGLEGRSGCTAGALWQHLAESLRYAAPDGVDPTSEPPFPWRRPLEVVLERGPLARRLLEALGPEPSRGRLFEVYERLCACLDAGEMFA